MSNVKFAIAVSNVNSTITFTDNGTDWTRDGEDIPIELDIYFRGEDKTTSVYSKTITSPTDINLFLTTGLVVTFTEMFEVDTPIDGFYQVDVVSDEGTVLQMLSDKMSVGFTNDIAELVVNNTLGVNVPVDKLETSLTLGMMHQSLELLQVLSTEASYSYDRENKWRKLFNYLTIVVNGITY